MTDWTGVCIVTERMQAQRDFYRQVLQAEPQGDESFFKFIFQGKEISFYRHQDLNQIAAHVQEAVTAGECSLEFRVAEVDRLYERLQASNALIVKPPTTQPGSLRSVWCRDADGNLVNFYAAVTPAGNPGDPKQTVRAYFDRLLNARDLAVCDELLACDYVDHDAPPDTPPGPLETKRYAAVLLDTYPDLCVEINELMAEGSKVALQLEWRGHHRQTGEPFHIRGIVIVRLNAGGQLAERWSVYQPAASGDSA